MKKDKFIPEFKDIPQPRQKMPDLPLEERLDSFREVELGFTEEMAQAEARRCLSCRRCIGCGLCLAECDANAIEYDQGPETLKLEVASIVLAPGTGETNPKVQGELGYSRFANVITSLELERILSPNGPYGGFFIRPYDGEVPHKIAFVLCVGCRDADRGVNFCGKVCCQAAIGELLKIQEQVCGLQAKVFYKDIRPLDSKGEEAYLQAEQASNIEFLQANVKEVSEDSTTKDLLVKYEINQEEQEETFELVVLSTGFAPSREAATLARRVGVKLGKFNLGNAQPQTPLESTKDGIFVVGSFAGATDISDTFVQAGAVAGKVAIQLSKEVESEKNRGSEKIQVALVVGGGVSGIQASLNLAEQGIETFLVERETELGGQARKLHYLFGADDPQVLLKDMIQKVTEHSRVQLLLGAQLTDLQGEAGDFQAIISQGESQATINHGALIVATGGREGRLEESAEFSCGKDPRVLTQSEYEAQLAQGDLRGDTVAMIQCVGSRSQAHPYCSQVCCSVAIKNALKTLQLNPKAKVYVLYRDLRPYGLEEEYLAEAQEKGVVFLSWSERPQFLVNDQGLGLKIKETAQAEEIRLQPDQVVLSMAALPQPDGDILGTTLGVERNTYGFFQEKDGADRPLELSREGIYVCGWARHPAGLVECICQADSAAAKVVRFLRQNGSKGSR